MTTTTTVHIYAVNDHGSWIKWEDQEGAQRAIALGCTCAAQIAGFPPVYAMNQADARDIALRKARRHFRSAKLSGDPGFPYSWDLARRTTDVVTP